MGQADRTSREDQNVTCVVFLPKMFNINLTTYKSKLKDILQIYWRPGLFKKVNDGKDDDGDNGKAEGPFWTEGDSQHDRWCPSGS